MHWTQPISLWTGEEKVEAPPQILWCTSCQLFQREDNWQTFCYYSNSHKISAPWNGMTSSSHYKLCIVSSKSAAVACLQISSSLSAASWISTEGQQHFQDLAFLSVANGEGTGPSVEMRHFFRSWRSAPPLFWGTVSHFYHCTALGVLQCGMAQWGLPSVCSVSWDISPACCWSLCFSSDDNHVHLCPLAATLGRTSQSQWAVGGDSFHGEGMIVKVIQFTALTVSPQCIGTLNRVSKMEAINC